MKAVSVKTCLLLILTTMLLACEDDNRVSGSGPMVDRTLELPAIRGLDIASSVDVVISQGDTQEVTVRGQANLADVLSTEVVDGIWNVDFTVNNIRIREEFTVFITVLDLGILEVSGAADIMSEGDLDLDTLTINSTSASDIALRGSTDRQVLQLDGSSDIKNFELGSREVVVMIEGAADVEVTATELLDVRIDGSGTVTYRGNPGVVNTDVSGADEVVRQ